MTSIDKKNSNSAAVSFCLLFATVLTLYFNSKVADPFNAPKMYILILSSAWLLGYIVINIKETQIKIKVIFYLNIFFLLTLLILSVTLGLREVSFFGEAQRQLGFLTYFGFSVFMVLISLTFSFNHVLKFILTIGILSMVYVIYGLMQFTGNDFVDWINQYNPIIGTLGNPNFAAAFMAMLGVLSFSFAFNSGHNNVIRIFFLIVFVGLLININLSGARQGLLSLSLGVAVFISFIAYLKNKTVGRLIFLINFVLGLFIVGGMLQVGPFKSLLYKDSVTLRGYYWDAGLNMFKANPLTGVGIDRYGAYFKLYRDSAYPLKYGFELNSTNAHNVFIQQFATGGIFLGLFYCLIHFYILYRAFKGLNSLSGSRQVSLLGFFSAWLAYIAQGIVSIDNIGLTIWGWILGGIIISLSKTSKEFEIRNKPINENQLKKINFASTLQVGVSCFLMVFAILLVNKLYSAENKIMQLRNMISSPQGIELTEFDKLADELILDNLAQPLYKMELADYLIRAGQREKGIALLQKLSLEDPANPNYVFALGYVYESGREFDKAIEARLKLIKVDPYNVKNFLQLARLAKEVGNTELLNLMENKILTLAPNSEEAKIVKADLK